MARGDPTGTREYKEQRARFDERQASGHWTGKTKAQRAKEKAARAAKKNKGPVARGIGKLAGQGRELDKYVEMLGRK